MVWKKQMYSKTTILLKNFRKSVYQKINTITLFKYPKYFFELKEKILINLKFNAPESLLSFVTIYQQTINFWIFYLNLEKLLTKIMEQLWTVCVLGQLSCIDWCITRHYPRETLNEKVLLTICQFIRYKDWFYFLWINTINLANENENIYIPKWEKVLITKSIICQWLSS